MSEQTDTPRTDEAAWPETGLVEGHFARELERELNAVTEQRDELLQYNEAFRKETLICADCDAFSKKEYDQAIEQLTAAREEIKELNDKLDDAVSDATNAVNDIIRMKWQRDRLAEALKSMKNTQDPVAAETVQTTNVPAVDLPRLARLLGTGKSRLYTPSAGWQLLEHSGSTYEVRSDVFCGHCEGCGCTRCKFTGHTNGKEIEFHEPKPTNTMNNTPTPRTDEWETYCDECYYHMWRVRRKNERGFNDGFHLNNGEGARQLVELLNKQDSELTAARAEIAEPNEEYGTWWAQKSIALDELKEVIEQRDRLAANNNRVIELLKDGLQTDGSHHKQWYLNEVLKLINADIAKDVEMHWTHDRGIAP